MTLGNNSLTASGGGETENLFGSGYLFANPETDPKQKPEIEPEQLPKEDPGQADPDEEDDDDDSNPFGEPEIGDDPDEITKKTTIF